MNEHQPHSLWKSFGWALRGIGEALIKQRNLRIHYYAATVAGTAACLLALSPLELLLVALAIVLVVSAELFNTAIEAAVDLASPAIHPLARLAKDAAAGAVLVCALFSLAVAWVVFADKLSPLRLRPGGASWALALAVTSLLGRGLLALVRRRRSRKVAGEEAPLSALE